MTKIHHLGLTASNLELSTKFYDAVLSLLGYTKHLTREDLSVWHGASSGTPEILLYASRPIGRQSTKETYAPGIHHIALQVDKRETVNKVFEAIRELDITILDAPKEYPNYSEGYFAVYFLDPDGTKLEIAHIPTPTS